MDNLLTAAETNRTKCEWKDPVSAVEYGQPFDLPAVAVHEAEAGIYAGHLVWTPL
jgi:hypothetical protein